MSKKITLVSAIFPPEPVVSAQTSASLAHFLVSKGDEVTVITAFPNRPTGKLYPGFKRRLFLRDENTDGYKLIRCFSTLSANSSLLSRFIENISFGLTAGFALLFLPKPDAIYANTWPIFATGLLMLIASLRRIPVVLSIQDVYPESLTAQGRIQSDSLWVKQLRKIDTWISLQAQTVITISERFANIYRTTRKVKSENLVIVPNWIDETVFTNQHRGPDIRKQHGMDQNDFLVVYGGNIGIAAGLDKTIQAMSLISSELRIHLLIAGAGSQLSTCQALAEQIAPRNISFHTPWPAEETSAVLKVADVLLLPTIELQSDVSVPSKLITYMFSGRPVIALVKENSETAEVINQSGCGWVLPPGKLEPLAALIKEVSTLPKEDLTLLGKSGSQYAYQNFSSSINLPKIYAVLSHQT